MAERPISFSGPMVRAILGGAKTQTRRVVRPQPPADPGGRWTFVVCSTDKRAEGKFSFSGVAGDGHVYTERGREVEHLRLACPYGRVGDRLWVRETWRFEGTDMARHGRTHTTQDGVVSYLADGSRRTINTDWRNVELWMGRGKPKSRPSIHMPRWASRIALEVSGVRVERLLGISEYDALAEGVSGWVRDPRCETARDGFLALWDSINATRGHGWDTNPWVWVVEFSVAEVKHG